MSFSFRNTAGYTPKLSVFRLPPKWESMRQRFLPRVFHKMRKGEVKPLGVGELYLSTVGLQIPEHGVVQWHGVNPLLQGVLGRRYFSGSHSSILARTVPHTVFFAFCP
ncbi:MAG: hypothetical protein K2N07_06770, partial [Desulfovibrio sp.]|nr:hypothetical protein [Desulfovibrio sp.]